jgi:hypothetical protein
MADPEEKEPLLELRFDGGRFAKHTIPLDVLDELKAFQALVADVARELFFAEHQGRRRVPAGFGEAARLHLSATRHNCFTATLVRAPQPNLVAEMLQSANDHWVDDAMELSLAALESAGKGQPLPPRFPSNTQTLKRLADIGSHLGIDESITASGVRTGVVVAINRESRQRIAAVAHVDNVTRVEAVGEVCSLDDKTSRFTLRKLNETKVTEVQFKPEHRADLATALAERPRTLVSVKGWLHPTRIDEVESVELADHDRAEEIKKLWHRIQLLKEEVKDGWRGPDSKAPTDGCIARAQGVLTRLIADHKNIPRPKVFPTPAGGLQAEWVVDDWAIDLEFAPDQDYMSAQATSVELDLDFEEAFISRQVNAETTSSLADWFRRVLQEGT